MKKVAVIILNWNGESLLQRFLPSVVRNTSGELGTVIVADNHSEDNSVEFLKREYPEVGVLCLEANYGFAGGYNRAIELIDAEYVLLLNSDVEVESGWLEPLVKVLDGQPEVAAVQPKLKSWAHREYFEYAGASGGYIDKYGFPFCRGRILKKWKRTRDNMKMKCLCFGVVERHCVYEGKFIWRVGDWMHVSLPIWRKLTYVGVCKMPGIH